MHVETLHRRVVAVLAAAAGASTPRWKAGAELEPLATFPLSWVGQWQAERQLVAATGDINHAKGIWRALGGEDYFEMGRCEIYPFRFLRSGERAFVDRQFEVCSRCGLTEMAVLWDADRPSFLSFQRPGGTTELRVVACELYPSVAGTFGASEGVCVAETSSQVRMERFVRMSRTFRMTEAGIIQSKELIKTYELLEGVLNGADMIPTSTIKSQVQLFPVSRPYSDPVRQTYA